MTKERSHLDRRRFLKCSLGGFSLGLSWPLLAAAAPQGARRGPLAPPGEGPVLVFQGDSVTDAGRSKEDQRPNLPHTLGHGYAGLSAAHVLGEQPERSWQCYNRGVSGNKVFQLAERWEADCLALQPDVLSILIGVNDFWHTLTGGYDGTVETYERDYRALLDRTLEALPDVRLIIGEPFALRGGSAVGEDWFPAFDAYRAAARRVAEDYGAAWIPYQSLFEEALSEAPAGYWTLDGVHPAPAGNHLMARAWLDAFEKVLG